jgi:hypothetical protein
MRPLFAPITATALALVLLPSSEVAAQAKNDFIKCGPASWARPKCPACTAGDKTYVTVKYVEAAIAVAHDAVKDNVTDPMTEVNSLGEAVGAKPVDGKHWTESGQKDPEKVSTYCWAPVKELEIKPLKDKSYLIGSYYDGKCVVGKPSCYHVTMECRKQRGQAKYICNPSLQEFPVKDDKCEDSPRKNTCDCQPSAYFKCGVSGKGGAAKAKGKKKGKR